MPEKTLNEWTLGEIQDECNKHNSETCKECIFYQGPDESKNLHCQIFRLVGVKVPKAMNENIILRPPKYWNFDKNSE